MKSKILKIVLGLILFSALFITVSSAATTVKESVQDYDDIVYIIGSTRFDSNVVITAQRAANAGVNEAKRLVAMGKPEEIENLNLKTYCYNPYFDEWYEIQEEARTLTKEEAKKIEENLNIFFVNNKEKLLEFEYNANQEDVNILTNGVTFDGKKFCVPATKTEFKFLENNVEAIVKTKTDEQNKEELDYGNFEIEYTPSKKMVAKVGQKYYEDLAKAVKDATDSTVTLLKNVTITERLNITNNVILDLDGNTINIEGTNNKIAAQQNANVTIKNGNVISNTNYGLQAQDNAILNIEKDLNIKVSGTDGNAEQYGITMFDKATLNYAGNIVVERTGRFACGISGSGNEPKTTNTIVNILDGSIKVEEGVAIYQPQVGKANIKAGTLEANTVLGIKSGEIIVSGGILKATGTKNDAGAMPENIKLTGDTVYIEENTGYYGNVSVSITGGQLTSANGYIMQEFNPTVGTEKERNAVVKGNYETRTILENNNTIFTSTNEAALKTANETKYAAGNLEIVMQNPSLNGGTVTLLKDIDSPRTMELKAKVTLELNNCNLTIKEDTEGWGVFCVLEGGDLTINGDGIVDGTGNNKYSMVLCAEAGNITINGGTYTNTNIIGDSDHYDVIYAHKSGQIVINGGRFEGKTPAWLLNIYDKDRETAKIEVRGGEFVGFDPANNKAEGEGTNFVADGYKSVEKDGVYTVVPVE